MASEENKERFYDTLLELARQIKLNAQTINIHDVSSIIELILKLHKNNNRVIKSSIK
ncbi:MAG: hypothetical protein KAT57_13820 [Candidatus Lokiarchaeota archaeon]|nr:hypothetical protein [Candidatus Lokiarchaeota archaeon]